MCLKGTEDKERSVAGSQPVVSVADVMAVRMQWMLVRKHAINVLQGPKTQKNDHYSPGGR